jgi:protein-tyrosine phosphatase
VLASPGALPAIVHCAGGKDRTGLTVALLLSALGVDRDTVLDEYAALPGTPAHAARQDEVHASFVSMGVEPGAARALLSTPRWAMAETLDWVDERHGTVEGYLRGPAGVTPETLEHLRGALLV